MGTYAELMGHQRLNQPIPRKNDIGLGRDTLGKLQEHASSLRQALSGDEDALLHVLRQGRQRGAIVELRRRR